MGTFLSKNNENDGKEKGETPRDNEEDYEESEEFIYRVIEYSQSKANMNQHVLQGKEKNNDPQWNNIAILTPNKKINNDGYVERCMKFEFEKKQEQIFKKKFKLLPKMHIDIHIDSAFYDNSEISPKLLLFMHDFGYPSSTGVSGACRQYVLNQKTNIKPLAEISLSKEANNTYVHESVFPTNIQPWFKENAIDDTSVSAISKNLDPHSATNNYGNYFGAFMVPMVMIVGIFVGKYFYQKLMRKRPAKKKQML